MGEDMNCKYFGITYSDQKTSTEESLGWKVYKQFGQWVPANLHHWPAQANEMKWNEIGNRQMKKVTMEAEREVTLGPIA